MGFWRRVETYVSHYDPDYDCSTTPTSLDVRKAHLLMQLHCGCPGRSCVPRGAAIDYLILNGYLRPEARSSGRRGRLT